MAAPAGPLIAVVQARMGSQRLPGKVLEPIGATPMLGHVLDRLARCRTLDAVAVATSDQPGEDPVADYAAQRGTPVVRGPLDDVAGRFLTAAAQLGAAVIVRISGDSPFMDPALVDHAVGLLDDGCDLVTNVRPRSFPPGESVEVLRVAALAAAHPRMDPDDREHVTPRLYRPQEGLHIRHFAAERDYGVLRLTVDTPQELAFARALVARMDPARDPAGYGLDEIADLAAEVVA
jgi:spore coat polysaccharide biosynthesis protein SpsF (cytidylyltransferase family)